MKTKTEEQRSKIKVEKNIPIPPVQRNGGRPLKYPFDELTEVDSTFFVEGVSGNTLKNAATAWSKRNKKKYKFTIREIEEGGKVGVRIWRSK